MRKAVDILLAGLVLIVLCSKTHAVEDQSEIGKTGRLGDMLNFYYREASSFKKALRNLL